MTTTNVANVANLMKISVDGILLCRIGTDEYLEMGKVVELPLLCTSYTEMVVRGKLVSTVTIPDGSKMYFGNPLYDSKPVKSLKYFIDGSAERAAMVKHVLSMPKEDTFIFDDDEEQPMATQERNATLLKVADDMSLPEWLQEQI